MSESLKDKTVKGVAWSVINNIVLNSIPFLYKSFNINYMIYE